MLPEIVFDYLRLLDYMKSLSFEYKEEEIRDCKVRLENIWNEMDDYEKKMLGNVLYGE